VLDKLSSLLQPNDTTLVFGNKPFVGRIEGQLFVMRRLSFVVRRGSLPKISGKVEANTCGTTIDVTIEMHNDAMKLLVLLLYFFQVTFVFSFTLAWIAGRGFLSHEILIALVVFLGMFLPVVLFNGEAIYAIRTLRKVVR
jgi:hypothetical protein